MAAVTHRSGNADTGATPNTSNPSFTPATGDLLVALIATSGSSEDPGDTLTASANGITLSRILTAVYGSSAHTLSAYVADQLVGASPVGMNVTWTPVDPGTGTVIFVCTVSAMSRTGLSAIRQSAKQDNQTTGTPAPSFAAAALTGNPTIGVIGLEGAGTANTAVPPTGWTEQADVGFTTPSHAAEYCTRDSGFTGTTITWTSATVTIFGAIILELDTSAASTATKTPAVISQYGGLL